MSAETALWLTVVAVGVYHGLNPAMGWPLAVANGMTARRSGAVFGAMLPLAGGHFAAMAVVLVPFAALSWYAEWSRSIRIGAGALVAVFGAYRLIQRRHPRALARIKPTQIAWWSFLMATAHGAGLMLLPFMLRLCASESTTAGSALTLPEQGHAAVMSSLAQANVATAIAVSSVHTLAMVIAGLVMAWIVYRYLGLRFLRSAWFNLDALWGASLIVAGVAGVAMAI